MTLLARRHALENDAYPKTAPASFLVKWVDAHGAVPIVLSCLLSGFFTGPSQHYLLFQCWIFCSHSFRENRFGGA